jgi:hypothetical protein
MPAGAVIADGAGATACVDPGAPAPTLTTAADLVVTGFTGIGPAVTLTGAGPYPHGVDIVLGYTAAAVPKGFEHQVVILAKKGNAPAHAALISNMAVEPHLSRVHFHTPDVATYQPAIRTGGKKSIMRHYTFRAMAGPSMGGLGASINFWRHPDRYDALGVMGADVPADLTYVSALIGDFAAGGFCNAVDHSEAMIGQLCEPKRKPLVDQHELAFTYEKFLYQAGDGVGLTLNRNLYFKGNRDLARAMGNAAYYNPDSPYRPPGVPQSHLELPNQQACLTPVVLKKFYDRKYNPKGTYDVITYCDGNDSPNLGFGVFDPAIEQTVPVQIQLAVDVNGNGKRDSGEPVLVQSNEPFEDVGTDGKSSKDEAGYDAVKNPDPAGDDYHYLWNPTGTENNWKFDQGEPYQDVGVDGISMVTAGCPAMTGVPECYDYGEGNGKFDYVPTAQNWRDHDPRLRIEKLDPAQLERIDVYYDAGIRDFFNTHVATNSLMGALLSRGQPTRLYEGFPAMVNQAPSKERLYDVNKMDFAAFGRHLYVRYGNPDASESEINDGDGRHVGAPAQVIHRMQTLLYWFSHIWPGGDRRIIVGNTDMLKVNGEITVEGRKTPYTIVLPPGYNSPEGAATTYPVIYLGHGYGMQPVDLAAVAAIAQNAMLDERVPESRRMQKFIIVLVDAACRPEGDVAGGGPVDPAGDLCETGAFYTDHPEGPYNGEKIIIDLQAEIESKYRTRKAEDIAVEQ